MRVEASGSVRVDLLGGTIDLNPINLILPDVVTLNLATSLKAEVVIEEGTRGKLVIASEDYGTEETFDSVDITKERLLAGDFDKLNFVLQILYHQGLTDGIRVNLKSGSPPGAGLGGSSSMGVTLFSAIRKWKKEELDREEAIKVVNSLEARILNKGPAGYQDYYPAMYGGVLALEAGVPAVKVHQLWSAKLSAWLEENFLLIYSGVTRLSGINNWEVYKSFFDDKNGVREGLAEIASLSHQAWESLKAGDFSKLGKLVAQEGAQREKLFPNILSPEMKKVRDELKALSPETGVKVCGAGGGGCFLVLCPVDKRDAALRIIEGNGMTRLPFKIEEPL